MRLPDDTIETCVPGRNETVRRTAFAPELVSCTVREGESASHTTKPAASEVMIGFSSTLGEQQKKSQLKNTQSQAAAERCLLLLACRPAPGRPTHRIKHSPGAPPIFFPLVLAPQVSGNGTARKEL